MTPALPDDILSSLNPEQRSAVEALEGPILILAGAGTGKTKVLTTRLGYILQNGFAYPYEILAVTFTNKAAQEMRERVTKIMGRNMDGLWLGTFHSLALRIIRKYSEYVGLQSNFTILDTDDQLRLIKQILKAEDIDEKTLSAKSVMFSFNRWKDQGLIPENVKEADRLADKKMIDLYKFYQERLITVNAVDFGDILLHCLTLFKNYPDILKTYQKQFRYILVDEYQDTNVSQYIWLRLLAQHHQNLCCVGDDDQSIYGWRGAEVGNILRFEKDYPQAKVVRLEQNYRSSAHILGAASGLIEKNKNRLGKTLWTEIEGGEKVVIRGTWDHEDEARFVGSAIEEEHRIGTNLSDIAILVRAGFQTRQFEERLLVLGIPYRVIGGMRFYERQEIRDALAYLRLIVQPEDSLAFERIINTPKRGIGTTTLKQIHEYARSYNISLTKAAYDLTMSEGFKLAVRTTMRQFFTDLERWRRLLREESPSDLTKLVLEESGYVSMWQQDKSPDAPGRLENLKELVQAIDEFDTLEGFLEHVSLVMDTLQKSNQDVVSIMTLHSAKGLEFDTVFLPGWEEGLFPHSRSLDEKGEDGLEEERRLAYVGLTRAKRQAVIMFSLRRKMPQGWQQSVPSRFLIELSEDHVIFYHANGSVKAFTKNEFGAPQLRHDIKTNKGYYQPHVRKERSDHSFQIGDPVRHGRFGTGTITSIDDQCLEIEFTSGDLKNIMADFVEKID